MESYIRFNKLQYLAALLMYVTSQTVCAETFGGIEFPGGAGSFIDAVGAMTSTIIPLTFGSNPCDTAFVSVDAMGDFLLSASGDTTGVRAVPGPFTHTYSFIT